MITQAAVRGEGPTVDHGPVPSARRNCLFPLELRREGLAHSAHFFRHGGHSQGLCAFLPISILKTLATPAIILRKLRFPRVGPGFPRRRLSKPRWPADSGPKGGTAAPRYAKFH